MSSRVLAVVSMSVGLRKNVVSQSRIPCAKCVRFLCMLDEAFRFSQSKPVAAACFNGASDTASAHLPL